MFMFCASNVIGPALLNLRVNKRGTELHGTKIFFFCSDNQCGSLTETVVLSHTTLTGRRMCLYILNL